VGGGVGRRNAYVEWHRVNHHTKKKTIKLRKNTKKKNNQIRQRPSFVFFCFFFVCEKLEIVIGMQMRSTGEKIRKKEGQRERERERERAQGGPYV